MPTGREREGKRPKANELFGGTNSDIYTEPYVYGYEKSPDHVRSGFKIWYERMAIRPPIKIHLLKTLINQGTNSFHMHRMRKHIVLGCDLLECAEALI